MTVSSKADLVKEFDRARGLVNLPAIAPASFYSVTNFISLTTIDPAVAKAQMMTETYNIFRQHASKYNSSTNSIAGRNSYGAIGVAVTNFLGFTGSLSFSYGYGHTSGFAKLLESKREFVELHTGVSRILTEEARKLNISGEQIECLISEADVLFHEVMETLETASLAHLTLQTHLEHIVTPTRSSDGFNTNEVAELFNPLFDLRDEYFATARVGLLREYLSQVVKLEASTDYELMSDSEEVNLYLPSETPEMRRAKAAFPQSLEDLTVKLEVMALMEESL